MEQYNTNKRYCPHALTTKIHSVETYRKTKDISYVCRKYHISKASLKRWNRLYNGSLQSLVPKSHKPHSPHPNSHTQSELKRIIDYHRRSPNISVCELILLYIAKRYTDLKSLILLFKHRNELKPSYRRKIHAYKNVCGH